MIDRAACRHPAVWGRLTGSTLAMEISHKAASQIPHGRGFDYGIGITVGAVGSMEFKNNLRAAEILAVGYGFDHSKELGVQVPAITLIGKNIEPLRAAFDEFWTWTEEIDADAIDLTIALRNDGGYNLCIGPEVRALFKRTFRFDAVANPLAFQLLWIKPIETTSQPLRDFCDHVCAGFVRPFLLRAAHYVGPLPVSGPQRPNYIRPILDQQDLLKFEIRFVDEGSREDVQWQKTALGKGKEPSSAVEERKSIPKSVVRSRRRESLKSLYPVTLWRSKSCERLSDVRTQAQKLGLHEWQIDQAICNLVLSREVCGGRLHFCEFSEDNWLDNVWEALRNRFEVSSVDHNRFAWLTTDDIVTQAMLDAKALLGHYKVMDVKGDMLRTQQLLDENSLLGDSP